MRCFLSGYSEFCAYAVFWGLLVLRLAWRNMFTGFRQRDQKDDFVDLYRLHLINKRKKSVKKKDRKKIKRKLKKKLIRARVRVRI